MAQEIRIFSVTVPPGTAIATPQKTALTMPARRVEELEIRVPPGPRGEVGFTLGSDDVQVIPLALGTWIVTDDEVIRMQLEGFWDSGRWECRIYNTGRFPHTISVRFLLATVQSQALAAPPPIPADQLGAAPVTVVPAPPGPMAPPPFTPPPLPVPPPVPPPPL